jgi:hypothetical protein
MRTDHHRSARRCAAALALTIAAVSGGCYTTPDTSQRVTEDIVVTKYDPTVTFSGYATFAVDPTVRAIGEWTIPLEDGGLPSSMSSALITSVEQQLTARGFTEVQPWQRPDLGISISAIGALNVATYVVPYAYWGYGYPYYWGYPAYGYYAPWSYSTTVWKSGTVTVEAFDLKAAAAQEVSLDAGPGTGVSIDGGRLSLRISCIWAALVYGVASDTTAGSVNRIVAGIEQAFTQSPYFHK